MSLENEIKKLTTAIEALTSAMTAQNTVSEPTPEADKEMPTVEEVYENSPPSAEEPKAAEVIAKKAETANMTKSALQSWCIGKVRDDAGFKTTLMGVLKKYDVKTINALPDDALSDVYSKLGGE